MKVNIYLETDKQCQARVQRRYGYVIEAVYAGRTETREGFGNSSSTYHQCNLQALIEALSRFRSTCEICIYTRDTFVTSRVLRILDLAADAFTVMTEDHVKARNTDYCGYAIADGGVISTKAHSLLKHTVTEATSDTDQKTQAGE